MRDTRTQRQMRAPRRTRGPKGTPPGGFENFHDLQFRLRGGSTQKAIGHVMDLSDNSVAQFGNGDRPEEFEPARLFECCPVTLLRGAG